MAGIAVIGCGNPNRTDDGVGPRVIALLREDPPAGDVRLFDAGTDGMAVLYPARGASHLVIVDARAPGDNPGAIYEVPGDELQAPPPASFNLHDFRWDHALYAGRRIYGDAFPHTVAVLLIEAADLGFGLELTPRVAAAAVRVAGRIRTLTAEWAEAVA